MKAKGPLDPLQEPSAVVVIPHEQRPAEEVLSERLTEVQPAERIVFAPLYIP